MSKSVYCFDTNVLIDCANKRYPKSAFPKMWGLFEELIGEGPLIAPDSVLKELERHDDELFRWAAAQRRMWVPFDGRQDNTLVQMASAFPPLTRPVGSRGAASETDQLVVAVAHVRDCLVVSHESRGSSSKPKIPELCARFRVTQIGILDVILEEGWVFD